MLLGMPEYVDGDPARYYNSVMSFGVSPTQTYRKSHLVPFGEFIPLRPFLAWVMNALQIPLSDFSRGDAVPARRSRSPASAWRSTSATRTRSARRSSASCREATLLVNVTNVAWFGDSLAAAQHLQISQMRALETGRYMLRATNTGVTAVIDQRGRVLAAAPQFVTTAVDGIGPGLRRQHALRALGQLGGPGADRGDAGGASRCALAVDDLAASADAQIRTECDRTDESAASRVDSSRVATAILAVAPARP